MKNKSCKLAAMLLVLMMGSSCIGPFNATSRLLTWNREMEQRWVGEGVYLVFRAVHVYGAFFLGDALIFNSIEFWGGDNPVAPPSEERIKALQEKDDARAAEAAKSD